MEFSTKLARCGRCTNNCLLTINRFSGNRQFITGNRCERALGKEKNKEDIPNLFEYKLHRVFDYEPLSEEEAVRGTLGIPRVLNMYEDYPFWAVLFKELKFRLILSPTSTRKIYEMGIESIPSESECYPAKLAHGHIAWLIKEGVQTIFYPCIPYERNEFKDAGNNYNCPIVTSYAENIKNNVDDINSGKVKLINPFLALTDEEILTRRLTEILKEEFGIREQESRAAIHKAWEELAAPEMICAKKARKPCSG